MRRRAARRSPPAHRFPRGPLRSLGESRSSLLDCLEYDPKTIDQLANALALSRTAVRFQLTGLQRDGLVERVIIRRGAPGKPAHGYRLTSMAAIALSTAYAPMAVRLLSMIRDRLLPYELPPLLRSVGRSLAARHRSGSTRLRARLHEAAAAITALGGRAVVVETDEGFSLTSARCPLSALTEHDPTACHAIEAFAGEIVGTDARHRCEHGDHPRCRFDFARDDTLSDASGDPGE